MTDTITKAVKRKDIFCFVMSCLTIVFCAQLTHADDAEESTDHANSPFPTFPIVDKVVVRGDVAYICWPKAILDTTTLTAISPQTLKIQWLHSFEDCSCEFLCSLGDLLYCRLTRGSATEEVFVRMDSGSVVMQRQIPVDDWSNWIPEPLVNETYLITGHIFQSSHPESSNALGFGWSHAIIHDENLYSVGTDETKPKGRWKGMIKSNRLRRTSLKSGKTEYDVELPKISDLKKTERLSWTVVGATADLVFFQATAAVHDGVSRHWLFGFDMAAHRELFRCQTPCKIRRATWRTGSQLECQCLCQTDADTVERLPLLVDWETGECRPDPNWQDPYMQIYWYSDYLPVSYILRGPQFLVAGLGRRQIICVDSQSGNLHWRREYFGGRQLATNDLGTVIVTANSGGVEVTNIATGETTPIRARNLGLPLAEKMRLPLQLEMDDPSILADKKYDRLLDYLLVAVPVTPLFMWVLFRVFISAFSTKQGKS